MNTNTVHIGTELRAAAPAAGWLAPLWRAAAAIRRRYRRGQAIAELSRMPDWRLEDMGISRGQIVDVVLAAVVRVDRLVVHGAPPVGGALVHRWRLEFIEMHSSLRADSRTLLRGVVASNRLQARDRSADPAPAAAARSQSRKRTTRGSCRCAAEYAM